MFKQVSLLLFITSIYTATCGTDTCCKMDEGRVLADTPKLLCELTSGNKDASKYCTDNSGNFEAQTSYCYKAITYTLDPDTWTNHQTYGEAAYQLYKAKYTTFQDPSASNKPDKNCLSVMRLFFCGLQFPRCEGAGTIVGGRTSSDSKMCGYLCNVLQNRCPQEKQLYTDYCTNQGGDLCQPGQKIVLSMFLVIFTLVFLL